MRGPLIIGHRGFAGRFAHNSLAGIQEAVALGVDGVELDLRPTREGVWVCHHDRSRDGRPLQQWSYRELAQHKVPALAAALEAVPADRWLFLEVKPLAGDRLLPLLDTLARLVEGLTRVQFLSSSLRVLALLRQAFPRARFSWVVGRPPLEVPPGVELSPHHPLVEALIALSLPLHPWTVNRPARLRRLAQLGVASITTDFPDRALQVLRG